VFVGDNVLEEVMTSFLESVLQARWLMSGLDGPAVVEVGLELILSHITEV